LFFVPHQPFSDGSTGRSLVSRQGRGLHSGHEEC
jgi:hypothetical protein